jgi:hypothetical protein
MSRHPSIALPELRFVVTYFLPPLPLWALCPSDKTDIGGRTIPLDFISGWDIALTDIL